MTRTQETWVWIPAHGNSLGKGLAHVESLLNESHDYPLSFQSDHNMYSFVAVILTRNLWAECTTNIPINFILQEIYFSIILLAFFFSLSSRQPFPFPLFVCLFIPSFLPFSVVNFFRYCCHGLDKILSVFQSLFYCSISSAFPCSVRLSQGSLLCPLLHS